MAKIGDRGPGGGGNFGEGGLGEENVECKTANGSRGRGRKRDNIYFRGKLNSGRGIPFSHISGESDTTTVAEGDWSSVEEHQWNSGPGSESENPAVGPEPLAGWHRPYQNMDAHQQNSGPGSEVENPAVEPGLLVAGGPQPVGPSGHIRPYEVAVNFVDGWLLSGRK